MRRFLVPALIVVSCLMAVPPVSQAVTVWQHCSFFTEFTRDTPTTQTIEGVGCGSWGHQGYRTHMPHGDFPAGWSLTVGDTTRTCWWPSDSSSNCDLPWMPTIAGQPFTLVVWAAPVSAADSMTIHWWVD